MNKDKITIVMFHRVLSPQDKRWKSADPEYTVSDVFFRDCLTFFQKHYNVISLNQLKNKELPPNPLLITFDDGWSDNYEYAYPILKSENLPTLLFLASDFIDHQSCFWQEIIYGLNKQESVNEDQIRNHIAELSKGDLDALYKKTEALHKKHFSDITFMVTSQQIQEMASHNIAIGSHGKTHTPLTQVPNLKEELWKSWETICKIISPAIKTISFPHGRYNETVIKECENEGYDFMFTSDEILNSTNPISPTLGRINISSRHLMNGKSRLRPSLLALLLFCR